jgi:hypothetical protein
MGEVVERPMRDLLLAGPRAVAEDIQRNSPLNIFVWLGLIYLKTHLKDRLLHFHLDRRRGTQKIADDYDWQHLHHLHAVTRCFYTGSAVLSAAIGSFMQLPMVTAEPEGNFDYADLYLAQTMMLRLDGQAFITVFDDATGAISYFGDRLKKITGPINTLQLREVMVEVASLNLHLKNRPIFRSMFDFEEERHTIVVDLPELVLETWRPEIRGRLLYEQMKASGPFPRFARIGQKRALDEIKAGRRGFIFDDKDEFVPHERMLIKTPPEPNASGPTTVATAKAKQSTATLKATKSVKQKRAGKEVARMIKIKHSGQKVATTKLRSQRKRRMIRRAKGKHTNLG